MALVKAVVTLNRRSGIARDAVQNTFYFDTAEATVSHESIAAALVSFYNGKAASGSPSNLVYWLHDCLDRATGKSVITTTIIDPTSGHQTNTFGESTFTLGAMAAGSPSSFLWPAEVCTCLTYHGAPTAELGPGGIRPMSRRRGRLYLGPLIAGVWNLDASTKEVGLQSTFRTTVCQAGHELTADIKALGTGVNWVVYSKTTGVVTPVWGGWVDDAPDIQRRRGYTATTRTTFEAEV